MRKARENSCLPTTMACGTIPNLMSVLTRRPGRGTRSNMVNLIHKYDDDKKYWIYIISGLIVLGLLIYYGGAK